MRFLLTRGGGVITTPVSVSLGQGTGGTASGSDYQLPSVSILTEAYINVPVTDDSEAEWSETAVIAISGAGTEYVVGGSPQAEARIYDDDTGLVMQELQEERKGTPHEMDPGAILAINWDDDNDNGVADLSESGADPDVQPIAIGHPSQALAGATAALSCGSGVRLWADAERSQELTTRSWDAAHWGDIPATVYAEGVGVGSAMVTFSIGANEPFAGSSDTIKVNVLGPYISTPVFKNRTDLTATQAMETTDLRYTIYVPGLPFGLDSFSYTLYVSDAAGDRRQTAAGTGGPNQYGIPEATALSSFAEVAAGDVDHQYTGWAWVEITVNGFTAASQPVSTEVYELWITSFANAYPRNDWKVCVGDAIDFSATGSGDLVQWKWEMPDGKWTLRKGWTEGQPLAGPPDTRSGSSALIHFSDLAGKSNSDFGDAGGTVKVTAKDANGKEYQFTSTEDDGKKAKVFFDPVKGLDGNAPSQNNPPAWFVFWNQTAAGNPIVGYRHDLSDFGWTVGHLNNGILTSVDAPILGPAAYSLTAQPYGGGTTYFDPATQTRRTLQPPVSGYSACTGIDFFYLVVKHEMLHYADMSHTLTSHGGEPGPDEDYLSEEMEFGSPIPGHTLANESNSWSLQFGDDLLNDREFRAYWHEAYVWCFDLGQYDSVDWSKGGKQW